MRLVLRVLVLLAVGSFASPAGGQLPIRRDDSVVTSVDGVYLVQTHRAECDSPGVGTEFTPSQTQLATPSELGTPSGLASVEAMGVVLVPNPNSGEADVLAAATAAYGPDMNSAGSAAIYCIDGSTGSVSLFLDLPNTYGGGIGDLAYNPDDKVVYATNINDGVIYSIGVTHSGGGCPTGSVLGTLDPFAPAFTHPGDVAPVTSTMKERIVGLGYDRVGERLYWGRWENDQARAFKAFNNDIYSSPVDANGVAFRAPPPGLPWLLEIVLPADQGVFSSPVFDIAFDDSGTRMLVGTRSMNGDAGVLPGSSSVSEYVRSGGSWVTNPDILPDPPTGQAHSVGPGGSFASGGVDYDGGATGPCDSIGTQSLATADTLLVSAGVQIMDFSAPANTANSYLALAPSASPGGLETCRTCAILISQPVPVLGLFALALLASALFAIAHFRLRR